jgi:ferredoxin
MCVLACSAIKQDVFSFSGAHSFIDIEPLGPAGRPASFSVVFTDQCDGCSYCLGFCGFNAIEEPAGWEKAPHLEEIRKQHLAERRSRRKK